MTRRSSRHSAAPTIPPGPADPRGRDLLSRAVMAATWYLEVRAGRRPVAHLRDWVSPAVGRQLDGLVRRRRRKPTAGASSISLVRVWAQRQAGVAHVVVVLREHHRTRPVALAMEIDVDQPRIIALGLPEDHAVPPTSTPSTTSSATASADPGPSSSSLPALHDLHRPDESNSVWTGPADRGTRLVGSGAVTLLELVP